MSQTVDDGLRRRLDRLETRGRHVLSMMERRRALKKALVWAAPASVVGPLALALSAPFSAPTWATTTVAVAAAPILAATLAYVREIQKPVRPRAAALALLDHRLRLNDRLQTSDEFERLAHRTPFQEAALREAAPWVARVQDSEVDDEPAPLRLVRSRLWLWPVAGLMLLGAAFVIPQFSSEVGSRREIALESDLTPRSGGIGSDAPSANAPLTAGSSQTSAVVRDAEAGADPRRDRPGAGLVAAFQSLMARLSMAGDAAAPAAGAAARPTAPSQAAASGEGAGRGGQGAAASSVSRSSAVQNADAEQPRVEVEPVGGEAGAQDDANAPASEATKGQFAGARQSAPSPSRAHPPESNAGSPQAGEGQQPGRSRRGDQGQSNGEQSGGQGENGNQAGAETGPKKGRGVSSLMLATPMQDRLTGMISPGRIRTTTREGVPQPLPAGATSAQDRGTAQGEAGRTAPLAASPQEQRVTRDYFNARNGGGR